MSGQISETPILTKLSEALMRPVDAESLRRARLHLLDWMGCAVAGAKEPAGQVLRKRQATSPSDLAFVWGGLGNVLEMDDVDKRALLHPGPSIIPAALVSAQDCDASMSDLLSAIVRGYDATIRLGRAVGAGHYALWHSTGTCAAIGSAAAVASLLRLNVDETAHAMALAVSQSAGLWHTRHDPESMGKQLHTSHAARAGLDAAKLARDGFKGPLGILEGEQGFFEAMCPDSDAQNVMQAPDSEWLLHQVSFKPWPACRHAHAVIDATLDLKSLTALDRDETFVVRTYRDALKFCDKPEPRTVLEAKFSLQHCVATCVLRDKPKLEDFALDAISDATVAALRKRVRVEVGEEFETRYPGRFGAEVILGEHRAIAMDALGDPENPMTDSQIKQKAEALFAYGDCSQTQSQMLCDAALNQDHSAAELSRLMSEAIS